MSAAWREWGGLLWVWLLALPVAAAVVAVLARRRHAAGASASWAWRTAFTEVGMVVGTVPSLWMILVPIGHGRTLHPVPLVEITALLAGDPGFAAVQIGGNLLVFAAFGALAPLRWRIGLGVVLITAAVTSLTLETVQYIADMGRFSSADDVLLNTVGAGLAALISRRWWLRRAGSAVPAHGDQVTDEPASRH